MVLSKGTKAALWMGMIIFSLFIFMLVFRAFIYAGMYIEPGAPYGVSDIIELLLGSVFSVLIAISVFLAGALLVKGSVQSKKSGIFLIVFCGVLFVAYTPLHNIMARLGG